MCSSTVAWAIDSRATQPQPDRPTPYLDAAKGAAAWIRSHAIETEHGLVWPVAPDQSKDHSYTLYSGTPGVILFFLEMYRATEDKSYLRDARRGADELIAHLDEILAKDGTGFYVGLAGVGFALDEVAKASTEEHYLDAANRCARLISEYLFTYPHDPERLKVTDVIGGIAGTGLWLDAMRHRNAGYVIPAARLADELLRRGREKHGGLYWEVSAGFRNTYPNFSHGTAGIACFLARFYERTTHDGRERYLEAALAGARYLTEIAQHDERTCLVPRFDPDEYAEGEPQLFYISWCHGPAGTGRFFHRLWKVTGDEQWREWRDRCGEALLDAGLPARQPGFWNNVGRCCGNVGVAELCLSMFEETGDERYIELARRLTDDLLERATRLPTPPGRGVGGEGSSPPMLKWNHAEHRVQPENVQAQTGLMQGAAGIGLWLLRLNAHDRGREWTLRFPDDGF